MLLEYVTPNTVVSVRHKSPLVSCSAYFCRKSGLYSSVYSEKLADQDLAAGTCVVADRSMRELSGAELQEHPQALQTVNWQEPRVAATEPPPNLRFPSAR